MRITTMRRRRSSSLLRHSVALLATTLLLFGRTANVADKRPTLPWPCLFASASSITHRIASNYHQTKMNAASLRFHRDVIRPADQRRSLYNYNKADDQYVKQGAQNYNQGDDAAYADAQKAMQGKDDDVFNGGSAAVNLDDVDFDEVNIMPVSCVNYHNGHMIKFQFFEKSNYNCHFKNLGTFVVSIAHFMRAYFNYQALTLGTEFKLPADASYLNCIKLAESNGMAYPLYAKIGCQHRDTYTSTKLQLILYKDAQCSQQFENDEETKVKDGYYVGDYFMSNKVSFRPPFYSCQSCLPDTVSDTFTKRYTAWYDDDYISEHGKKTYKENEEEDDENQSNHDDANGYYVKADDVAVNDQYGNNNQADDNNGQYVAQDDTVMYNYKQHADDAFYQIDDGNRRLRRVTAKEGVVDASQSLTAKLMRKELQAEFDQGLDSIKRRLAEAEGDDAAQDYNADVTSSWNMCQRVYHYGGTCQDDCLKLDAFRIDEWSQSDIFLLVIMIVFMGAMMLLVFAKRVKAYERAAMWGDEPGAPSPGLPPCAILMLFGIVFTIIVVLAALKFVNETLVFAVVTCVLLFVYMLKLTLFESRKQVFLPARSTRKINPSLRHELI